jgi:predicted PolB exonuclease-like 3'-5' exonuclease
VPVLVFDVETVPDLPRLRAAGADLPEDDGEAWAALAAAERPPKPIFCRVVAIGAVWVADDGRLGACGPVGSEGDGEAELILQWHRFLERHLPRLVGWNSGGFDLPVLAHRAWVLGLRTPALYREQYWRRRDERLHVDLMDLLSGYGAAPRTSLHEAATALGLPGKGDVRGSDVAALWRASETERIRRYVVRDALVTALHFGRYAAHRGWWEEAQAQRLEEGARRSLAEHGHPEWEGFARAWANGPPPWPWRPRTASERILLPARVCPGGTGPRQAE